METSHIKNVALYAKNFYRHSGNIIKDMQEMLTMDGHKYWEVNTPAKILAVMHIDYLKWVDSLDEKNFNVEGLRKEVGDAVQWTDGPEAVIYSYIIKYKIYIPMSSRYIGYPTYDAYRKPQFNLVDRIFSKNCTQEEWFAAAKKILDKTHEEYLDEHMNNVLDKCDFKLYAKLFSHIEDKEITAKELEDELWERYTKFMDEHLLENGAVEEGYFDASTKHFSVQINTENFGCNIDIHCLLNEKTWEVNKQISMEVLSELVKMASSDYEFIDRRIYVSGLVNEIVEENYFSEKQCKSEWIVDAIEDAFDTFSNDYFQEKLQERKEFGMMTGGFEYIVRVFDDKTTLTIRFIGIFECSCQDQELFNTGNRIGGPHE